MKADDMKTTDKNTSSMQDAPALGLYRLAIVFGLALLGAGLLSGCASTSNQSYVDAQGYTVSGSGLRFVDIVTGQGLSPKPGQNVLVHYTGWIGSPNGKQFDSSHDRGEPFGFRLGQGKVIRGWDEGVRGMKLGGKRRLIIPPELGYGRQGAGRDIPPNSVLVFDIELLAIR
jgi:peptidylprolyl isomerase